MEDLQIHYREGVTLGGVENALKFASMLNEFQNLGYVYMGTINDQTDAIAFTNEFEKIVVIV